YAITDFADVLDAISKALAENSDDIQCAGSDHDHYQEDICAHHKDHMMHNSVQLDHVVDSHADYTSDGNIILYDQYVKDNEVSVVHSDVSSVPTDAFIMIYDDMCKPHDQSVSYPSQNTAVQNSLTVELAIYKEHVELLYCRGKENGVNILKSIDEGPYKMGTFRETLAESTEGTPQFGLPKDIYSLINHYTDAKDICDNVNMLLEGSELTKEDRESQLYDDFEHFRKHKEESIHSYYVRFAKLINDMRNIKMTMSRLQLNSKFVNNML
nr:hypothetical protein [Tanacetum cinerariifolium]